MKKDWLEGIVYGLAAAMSGTMFFFGLLYPSYTYTQETYAILAPVEDEAGQILDWAAFEQLSQQDKIRRLYELDPSQIQYQSKLWEYIQKLKK